MKVFWMALFGLVQFNDFSIEYFKESEPEKNTSKQDPTVLLFIYKQLKQILVKRKSLIAAAVLKTIFFPVCSLFFWPNSRQVAVSGHDVFSALLPAVAAVHLAASAGPLPSNSVQTGHRGHQHK